MSGAPLLEWPIQHKELSSKWRKGIFQTTLDNLFPTWTLKKAYVGYQRREPLSGSVYPLRANTMRHNLEELAMTDTLSRLQTLFDDIFFEETNLTPETSAADVEEWDSLMHVTIVVAIEKAFDIEFATGEVEEAKNVGELCSLIDRKSKS